MTITGPCWLAFGLAGDSARVCGCLAGVVQIRGDVTKPLEPAKFLDALDDPNPGSASLRSHPGSWPSWWSVRGVRGTEAARAFPKDPADRLIAGTALAQSLPLVTSDRPIRISGALETIW
jgi:hypothetical protein